jgi:hypothetical protein
MSDNKKKKIKTTVNFKFGRQTPMPKNIVSNEKPKTEQNGETK